MSDRLYLHLNSEFPHIFNFSKNELPYMGSAGLTARPLFSMSGVETVVGGGNLGPSAGRSRLGPSLAVPLSRT